MLDTQIHEIVKNRYKKGEGRERERGEQEIDNFKRDIFIKCVEYNVSRGRFNKICNFLKMSLQ